LKAELSTSINTLGVSTPLIPPSGSTVERRVLEKRTGAQASTPQETESFRFTNTGIVLGIGAMKIEGKTLFVKPVGAVEAHVAGQVMLPNFVSAVTDLEGYELNILSGAEIGKQSLSTIGFDIVAPAEFLPHGIFQYGSTKLSHPVDPKQGLVDFVQYVFSNAISIKSEPYAASGIFSTSPGAVTVSVFDKKYSDVLDKIRTLRNPEPDEERPSATDFSYWNCLEAISGAYSLLKAEYPNLEKLSNPTALTDDWGGIRLIWRNVVKVVRANFGGRPDLKSYLYHESEDDYGIERLDDRTIATRLRWLL